MPFDSSYYRRLYGRSVPASCGGLDERLSARVLVTPSAGIVATENGFLFSRLEVVPGRFADVELRDFFADGVGNPLSLDYAGWKERSRGAAVTVPSSRIWYQMLRRLYEVRDADSGDVASCLASVRDGFDRWQYSLTGITYDGVRGVVEHGDGFGGDGSSVRIPEFRNENDWWTTLELAPHQPVGALGNVCRMPKKAGPVLELLLGVGYEVAGAVFQHACSPTADGSLRRVCFYTPTAKGRKERPSRALVLGVNNNNDGFNINANIIINNFRPARGVAVAQKISNGSCGV